MPIAALVCLETTVDLSEMVGKLEVEKRLSSGDGHDMLAETGQRRSPRQLEDVVNVSV